MFTLQVTFISFPRGFEWLCKNNGIQSVQVLHLFCQSASQSCCILVGPWQWALSGACVFFKQHHP